MAQETRDECETCDGERVVIGDATDRHGERTDDEQPCPDCAREDFDDRDDGERELDRDLPYLNLGGGGL